MCAWALPLAQIDINNPTAAEGTGALLIQCKEGLSVQWTGLQNGTVDLQNPFFQLNAGKIAVLELNAQSVACTQEFLLWKDSQNPYRSSISLFYNTSFPFLFASDVGGSEMIVSQTNTVANIDRPVTVDSNKLDIKSKNSLLFIIASKKLCYLYLYDENILADNAEDVVAFFPKPISFALHNAVFKTTKTNGIVLIAMLADDFLHTEKASLVLSFGIYAYLPILPDPYAANLGSLRQQFAYEIRNEVHKGEYNQRVWLMLVCSIQWNKETDENDLVKVSFAFAPLPQQVYSAISFSRKIPNDTVFVKNNSFIQQFAVETSINDMQTRSASKEYNAEMMNGLPDYQKIWDEQYGNIKDLFALLDVSSHANQMGISFQPTYIRTVDVAGDQMEMYKTYQVASGNNNFPLQITGMDVVTQNHNVKAFALPQVSWEPVLNLTAPEKSR